MSVLDQLLLVQEHDTAVDQLQHRRDHLPERTTLSELSVASTEAERRRGEVTAERDALVREQKRLEDEISAVEQKRTETDATLYSGSVTSPRELQSLQDELAALARRQDTLEDELLEILTAIEPLDAQLAELDEERARIDEGRARAEADLAAAEATIDDEIAEVAAERDAASKEIPADRLAEYETKRRQLGGIAVARLVGTNCGGCHLALSAVEIDRIRKLPADEPAVCEECGRLLVH